MASRARPLLVFDGDCHFCRRWIARWRQITGDRVEYSPYQEAAGSLPELPEEDFRRSVVLVETDGGLHRGAEAVLRALSHAPGRGWPLWLYRRAPGVAPVCELGYRVVARHRPFFSRATRWLWGPSVERPTWHLSRGLFVRTLALIYLVAFVSLGLQIPGLIGANGILPAGDLLSAAAHLPVPERYLRVPTLCWLAPGDASLRILWIAGAGCSLLALLGIAAGPSLLLCWLFYLSLAAVAREFLYFQWDALLLETGLLAAFFAPWTLGPRAWRRRPPSPALGAMLRWLLFRLMFASGVVKLASGDPTWWNLSALRVHFETQPLPTWPGWYAHQLPDSLLRAGTAAMFGVELVLPFLIFLPRRPRLVAFIGIVGLMGVISLTGNYGFFNLLTVALCLLLLDDQLLSRALPARWRPAPEPAAPSTAPAAAWRRAGVALMVLVLFPVSLMSLSRSFRRPVAWPGPLQEVEAILAPLRVVNGYGLFARMTTTRIEIEVEGSDDGTSWKRYPFRWKPSDPLRRPAFMQPHMPRLDWQMWFAALSDLRSTPWCRSFLVRLLQGSPDVLALLEGNPFPAAPPRYLRAVRYRYRFTDPETRRRHGAWWRREELGLYTPPVSLSR